MTRTPADELREWLNGPEAHEVAVRASGYGSARGSKIREIGDHLVGKILPALAEAVPSPSAGDELRAKVHQLIGAGWALAKLVDDEAAVAAHAGLAAEVDTLLERSAGDETREALRQARDDLADIGRHHTRAIWALAGEVEYLPDERSATGDRLTAALARIDGALGSSGVTQEGEGDGA